MMLTEISENMFYFMMVKENEIRGVAAGAANKDNLNSNTQSNLNTATNSAADIKAASVTKMSHIKGAD